MAIQLHGNWKNGISYDVHTLGSTYLGTDAHGYDHWDTVRSEMGELLYQLKYQNKHYVVAQVVNLLNQINGLNTMDAIIPVPSSRTQRQYQPVALVAEALGEKVGVPVFGDVLSKEPGATELKNLHDFNERSGVLKKQMKVSQAPRIKGKNILLLDDLYRSGATLRVATDLLYSAGCANVYVLTLTKTRSSR